MEPKPDLRAYINPQPALSEAEQRKLVDKLEPSVIYSETRGERRDAWITSLRLTSVALLPELFVLAAATGRKDKRFADLLKAKDEIHERDSYILEGSSGHRSSDKKQWPAMRDRAYAMLDGAVKSGKRGRAPYGFTPSELEAMRAIMDSRNYANWPERKAAIEARGIKAPSRTWCLGKLQWLTNDLGMVIELTPAQPKYKRAPGCKKLDPPAHVYFVRDDNAIKIGFSIKPNERVASLSGGNHRKLEVLGIIEGGREKEKELHRQFAKLRIKGEWFKASAELLTYIDGVCKHAGKGKFIRKRRKTS